MNQTTYAVVFLWLVLYGVQIFEGNKRQLFYSQFYHDPRQLFDILAINESKIDNSITDGKTSISGFN